MSDAKVSFDSLDFDGNGEPGKEQLFDFACPKGKGRCGYLLIACTTDISRDGQNENGGHAQWEWINGDRIAPTFTPSINCRGCWHGYIENGRCVDGQKNDEPEPV
jgi:hypothetical protein